MEVEVAFDGLFRVVGLVLRVVSSMGLAGRLSVDCDAFSL